MTQRAPRQLMAWATGLLLVAAPAVAFAQKADPKVGLTMSSPSTVGVIWHISDRVAIRPDVSFTSGGTRYTDSNYTNWSAAAGISALFYAGKWDAVRTYFAPRYAYSRVHTSSTSPLYSSKATTSVPSGSGSFGVQYSPHRRFMVFGEVGLNYSRQAGSSEFTVAAAPGGAGVAIVGTASTTTSSSPKAHSWSSRTVVGLGFYF